MGFPEELNESDNDVFWHSKILPKKYRWHFLLWIDGKAANRSAMKNIKKFCLDHDVDYSDVEEVWLDFEVKKHMEVMDND